MVNFFYKLIFMENLGFEKNINELKREKYSQIQIFRKYFTNFFLSLVLFKFFLKAAA